MADSPAILSKPISPPGEYSSPGSGNLAPEKKKKARSIYFAYNLNEDGVSMRDMRTVAASFIFMSVNALTITWSVVDHVRSVPADFIN